MTSTPRTVTGETKATHRGDATNCMIANLSICVRQRSGSASYRCKEQLFHWEQKLSLKSFDLVSLLCKLLLLSVEMAAVSVNTFGVASLTGHAGKCLPHSHSESPVCERMAGLLSAHFVLAGILWPIHCAPHWGTTDREEEWENNQERSDRKKGLSCRDDFFFFLQLSLQDLIRV